ncbi:MAG TPA: nitrogenase stabilizing/protective protein NifW [Polyangiales bacterium]
MAVLDDLKRLSSAEDFFQYLGVGYEPRVLQVARLHILKRMGQHLAAAQEPLATEAQVRQRCRALLSRAYEELRTETPLQARVFKVHRDAWRAEQRSKPVFVPLTALTKKR